MEKTPKKGIGYRLQGEDILVDQIWNVETRITPNSWEIEKEEDCFYWLI